MVRLFLGYLGSPILSDIPTPSERTKIPVNTHLRLYAPDLSPLYWSPRPLPSPRRSRCVPIGFISIIMPSPQRPEQSIRSSCDRCRSSKLKCVPSSDLHPFAPCQRCIRAKVKCVFGQRARNKLGPRRPRRSMSPVSEECRQEASSDETQSLLGSPSSTTVHCSAQDEGSSQFGHAMMPTPSLESTLEASSTTSSIMVLPNSNDSINAWREESWTTSSCPSIDTLNSIWTDNSIIPCGFVEDFQISQTQMTPSSMNRRGDIDFGGIFFQAFDGSTNMKKDPNSLPMGRRKSACLQLELSALLGEMQKYLHMLKTYHVSENQLPEDALNDYPIGEALYLLQRFCELQGRIRETGESPTWPQNAIDPDMVAALVIVTCYITMMRILYTLFGHLEQYLAQISLESAARARKSVAENCRGLRLGELTTVNDVCVRTREAVGALRNALRSMDLAIGTSHEKPWAACGMDDMTDNNETVALKDGLTINLLKEEAISSKIDDERTTLHAKILKVEQHLNRLLNCAADGQTAIASTTHLIYR
ncbi:hypothetical protein F4824DRAFT_465903 [Ustulina deusta]|nr:hypothetical protein F4823DRAFT_615820 [Ustulina deusta]KAI3335129.1 hypothetical protein F4824DRAFT_465903 [Ustulina deusta]